MAVTTGIEAISIGYQLSIGPAFILNKFKKSFTHIGVLLGVTTLISVVYIMIADFVEKQCPKFAEKIFFIKPPYNVVFLIFCIGIAAIVMGLVPNFYVFEVAVLFLMCFNDLASMNINVVQG